MKSVRHIFLWSLCSFLSTNSTPLLAYQQQDLRKIAAPNDTAIKMFLGYDSRTGLLKEQCIKNVTGRIHGANPDLRETYSRSAAKDQHQGYEPHHRRRPDGEPAANV